MTAKNPSEMSLEELKSAEKSLNIAVWALIICVVLMTVGSLIRVYNKDFRFTTFLPLFFIPITIINRKNLQAIRAEIAKRGAS